MPLWLVSAALGTIGMIGLIYKKTMLGMIVSIQMMVLGASVLFVLSGTESGAQLDGHVFAIFIVVGGIAQTAGAYALASRMFYLKNKTDVSELRELKR